MDPVLSLVAFASSEVDRQHDDHKILASFLESKELHCLQQGVYQKVKLDAYK